MPELLPGSAEHRCAAGLFCRNIKAEAPERQCGVVLDEVAAFDKALGEMVEGFVLPLPRAGGNQILKGERSMASEWADEAERQARAMTRDLAEVGAGRGVRVTYQKREARFALKEGSALTYFSAHDYETPGGMDWLGLRIDVLTRVKTGARPDTKLAVESRLI